MPTTATAAVAAPPAPKNKLKKKKRIQNKTLITKEHVVLRKKKLKSRDSISYKGLLVVIAIFFYYD